jgi:uncharacterized iron-regulated membrane protein
MSFIDKPQRLWWRKLLFQVHLWSGLAVGVIALVVGLTGSIIVFHKEMYAWQQPPITLLPGMATLSPEEYIRKAELCFPGLQFTNVYYPDRSGEAVTLMADNAGSASGRWRYVHLHPQTGEMVNETVTSEPFLDWAYRLHIYLLLGDAGYTVNGIHAFVLAALSITGIVIWWPGVRHWRRALQVNTRARWKRVNYDLHSAVGFFSALCLLLVALTGAYFRFHEPFEVAVEWITGSRVSNRADSFVVRQARDRIAPSLALRKAQLEIPDAKVSALYLPQRPEAPIRVRMKRAADNTEYGANEVVIDPHTGDVMGKRLYAERSAADTVLRWFGFIHFGTFGGLTTRILWVFLGAVPGLLAISGFLMWWNRVLAKRLQSMEAPAQSPKLAA